MKCRCCTTFFGNSSTTHTRSAVRSVRCRIGPLSDRPLPDRSAAGRLPDVMDPGIHGARTHWIRGFMAFQLARRIRDRDADGVGVT
jgi:hypothetical protein